MKAMPHRVIHFARNVQEGRKSIKMALRCFFYVSCVSEQIPTAATPTGRVHAGGAGDDQHGARLLPVPRILLAVVCGDHSFADGGAVVPLQPGQAPVLPLRLLLFCTGGHYRL